MVDESEESKNPTVRRWIPPLKNIHKGMVAKLLNQHGELLQQESHSIKDIAASGGKEPLWEEYPYILQEPDVHHTFEAFLKSLQTASTASILEEDDLANLTAGRKILQQLLEYDQKKLHAAEEGDPGFFQNLVLEHKKDISPEELAQRVDAMMQAVKENSQDVHARIHAYTDITNVLEIVLDAMDPPRLSHHLH